VYRPTKLRSFLLSNKSSSVLFFEYLMNSFACLCPGVLFQYEALVLASQAEILLIMFPVRVAYKYSERYIVNFAVNIDKTVGAVGFLPQFLPRKLIPIDLIRVTEDGVPVRGPDGLCIRCEPGKLDSSTGMS